MTTPRSGLRDTVMIVDDAPANLALLSEALEQAGYRVLVATDGASALEQLNYVTPGLILLDGIMPEIDGFETCRRMKARPATRHIPIIFMTALGELENRLRGFDEGAVDYITKPFRNEEVLARVGAQLAQMRPAQRAEQALSDSGLAALSIEASGVITWQTPAATRWLHELSLVAADHQAEFMARLPQPLRDWATHRMRNPQPTDFALQRSGTRYTASIAACQIQGEYLLLLQKRSGDWDFQSLQGNLGLTLREAEVLMWISRGKTNRDVGKILGSSPRTVNKHLEHAFAKLGVETRSAAVAVVMERMQQRH